MSKKTADQVRDISLGFASAGKKEDWLALFSEDAVVEDPVGVSPLDPTGKGHRSKAAIEGFWDNVISKVKVQFEVDFSYTCGNECASVVHIRNVDDEGNVLLSNRMITIHRINDEGKIASLRAFWDFGAMMGGGAG